MDSFKGHTRHHTSQLIVRNPQNQLPVAVLSELIAIYKSLALMYHQDDQEIPKCLMKRVLVSFFSVETSHMLPIYNSWDKS